MGAFASQSKWRWTWGSCWKVSTFLLVAVSQGTQSSDLISSKCSHPRSLLLVQVTLKRSPAGALGPSWWDVIVCQSSFLRNEKRFKCRPAGISVSGSQPKGACRLGCCLKCRGEKNGWALRRFVLTAMEEDGSGWTHVLPFSRSDILPMAESFFWTSLKISLTSFFFFVLKKWLRLVFFLNSNFKLLFSCWENVWWLFWATGKRAKLLHRTETLHNTHNAPVYLLSWHTSRPHS